MPFQSLFHLVPTSIYIINVLPFFCLKATDLAVITTVIATDASFISVVGFIDDLYTLEGISRSCLINMAG